RDQKREEEVAALNVGTHKGAFSTAENGAADGVAGSPVGFRIDVCVAKGECEAPSSIKAVPAQAKAVSYYGDLHTKPRPSVTIPTPADASVSALSKMEPADDFETTVEHAQRQNALSVSSEPSATVWAASLPAEGPASPADDQIEATRPTEVQNTRKHRVCLGVLLQRPRLMCLAGPHLDARRGRMMRMSMRRCLAVARGICVDEFVKLGL
ncbi:hypothetical protein BDK51DRAFT_25979, partial [Blyttiomyces helicus]